MRDNLNEFMLEYLRSVKDVAKIVTQMMDEETQTFDNQMDERGFDLIVCWQVTENIKRLIAYLDDSSPYNVVILNSTDYDLCISTISKALYQNKLVNIKYESVPDEEGYTGPEHHISCIGSNGSMYLIQFLPDECISSEVLSINDFLKHMYLIMIGEEFDWFNEIRDKQQLTIEIYDRKPLSADIVKEFLIRNQSFLTEMNSRINLSNRDYSLRNIPVFGTNKSLPRPTQQLLSLQRLLPLQDIIPVPIALPTAARVPPSRLPLPPLPPSRSSSRLPPLSYSNSTLPKLGQTSNK